MKTKGRVTVVEILSADGRGVRKKDTLPIEKWHKPNLAPAYLVKRQEEKQKKSCNNNQTKKKSGETTQAGFATRVSIENDESVGV